MGGGSRYPYPKWVWSWFGGWWPEPAKAKTNTLISLGIYSGILTSLFYMSSNLETRHQYPKNWIPSMLWSRDFNDLAFINQWKKVLKDQNREWIDTRPECIVL